MNKVDRNFLIGITVVSGSIFFAMKHQEKKGKPVRVLDLNQENSASLFKMIAVVSASVLVFGSIVYPKLAK